MVCRRRHCSGCLGICRPSHRSTDAGVAASAQHSRYADGMPFCDPRFSQWYNEQIATYAQALDDASKQGQVSGPTDSAMGGVPEPAFEGLLSSSIDTMMEARQAFSEDAKSAITMMLTLFAAGGALILAPYAAQRSTDGMFPLCHGLAAVAFGLVLPVSRYMLIAGQAGYELYVATAIYSAIVHRACGIIGRASPSLAQ